MVPHEQESQPENPGTMIDAIDWASRVEHYTYSDPFMYSPDGHESTGLGCFPIGMNFTPKDFTSLIQRQRRLKELGLLKVLTAEEIRQAVEPTNAPEHISLEDNPREAHAVEELLDLVGANNSDAEDPFRVYIGLESGFRLGLEKASWGICEPDRTCGVTEFYISGGTKDLAGTILHTFMSSRKFTRAECFLAERALSEHAGTLTEDWKLSIRVQQDILRCSPRQRPFASATVKPVQLLRWVSRPV